MITIKSPTQLIGLFVIVWGLNIGKVGKITALRGRKNPVNDHDQAETKTPNDTVYKR